MSRNNFIGVVDSELSVGRAILGATTGLSAAQDSTSDIEQPNSNKSKHFDAISERGSDEVVEHLRDAFEAALARSSGSDSSGNGQPGQPVIKTSSPLDLQALQLTTPKALERAWDLAAPKDAMELLTRFSKVNNDRLKAELEALPMMEFWEGEAESNFKDVDAALAALAALVKGLSEREVEDACRAMFGSGGEEITIRGVVIRDPGIIQAVKAIRAVRHPLTDDETRVAEQVFEANEEITCSKWTLTRILSESNRCQVERWTDVVDWYDLYDQECGGFEEALIEAFGEVGISEEYIISAKCGNDRTLSHEPLVRCLNIIRAKDTPEVLSDQDQEVLDEVLDAVVAEGSPLGFDRDSICEVVHRLQLQADRDYEVALAVLKNLEDDPIEIMRNARDILSNSEAEATLCAKPDMMDMRFWSNEELAQAMRIMAHQIDRPDFRLAGTDDDVPGWFFKNRRQPTYNLENISGLVGAMRDFSNAQADSRLGRLCEEYGFTSDPELSMVRNLENLEGQFKARMREYDAIGFAVSALRGRMLQGLEPVELDDILPEVPGAFEGLPVDDDLYLEVAEFREKTLKGCRMGNWAEAEENLARFGTVLNHVYAEYGESGFREIDFELVMDDLEEMISRAEKAGQWSFLHVALGVVTMGIWFWVRKVRARGYEDTAERAVAIRNRIMDFTSGEPISRIQALRQLRETVKRQVRPNVHDAPGREFMDFFTTYLDAAIYRDMQEDLLLDMTDQLKYLDDGGELSVTFSVGAGWGLPHSSKVEGGVKIKLTLAGGDDRRIREGESVSLEVCGSGDVGIATLSGTLGAAVKKGKTFKSVEDFVRYHRDEILNLVLTEGGDLTSQVARRRVLKRAEDLNCLTKSQMDRFNHAARFMGIMGPSEGVFVDPNRKPVPTRTWTVGGSATLQEKLGFSRLKVALKQKVSHSRTFFYKRIDYLEYLKSNLDLLTTVEAPKKSAAIGLARSYGYEPMEQFKEDLAEVSQRSVRARLIVETMSGLHTEFEQYCRVTRHRDSLRGRFSRLWPSKMAKELRAIKQSFQNERGVRHRGSYIRACMLTYANLLKLLQDEVTPEELALIDLSEIEKTFTYPKVELNEAELNKMKKALRKEGTKSEVLFSAAASPGFGLTAEVVGAIQEVRGNANPDNDGVYLNLSLQATAETQKVLAGLVSQLEAISLANLSSPGRLGDAVTKALASQISTGAEGGPPFRLGLIADLTGKVELHFIKNPSLRLQYVRVSGITTYGAEVKDVPLGLGGMLSVGAKKEVVKEFSERIGNNTLTFVQTQFNGFKLAGGDWEQNWLDWCGEDFNRRQLWKMAKNLGDESTNIHRELKGLAKGAKGPVKQSYLELVDLITEILKNKQEEADSETMEIFCTRLGRFFAATKSRATLRRARLLKRGWNPQA